MAWNRYENYQTSEYQLPKADLNILSSVLQAKQQRWDTSYELAQELKNKYIDALQQDNPRARELEQKWQGDIDAGVMEYDGDYAAYYRKLRTLAQDIERQFKPGGEAAAMMANKQTFVNMQKQIQDRIGKEVNADQLQAWYNYYMNPESPGYFKGTGKKDPVTGNYNVFNPEDVINYVNPDDVVVPVIEKLKADGYSVEQDEINGNWIMRHKESGKVLSEEDVTRTAYRSLANDPNYMAGLNQMAKFKNVEGFNSAEYALGLAKQYGQDFAYKEINKSETIRENPWEMFKAAERGRNARHRDMFPPTTPPVDPRVGNVLESNFGSTVNITEILNPAQIIPGTSVMGIPSYSSKAMQDAKAGGNKARKISLQEALDNGIFEAKRGNKVWMQNIINNNPTLTDEEKLDMYNQSVIAYNSTRPAYLNIDSEIMKQKEDELFGQRQIQTTSVMAIVDPKTNAVRENVSGMEFFEMYQDQLYDPKTGKKMGQWGGLGATRLDNKYPGTYQFIMPDGAIAYVKDTGAYGHYSEALASMGALMYDYNKKESDVKILKGITLPNGKESDENTAFKAIRVDDIMPTTINGKTVNVPMPRLEVYYRDLEKGTQWQTLTPKAEHSFDAFQQGIEQNVFTPWFNQLKQSTTGAMLQRLNNRTLLTN